jgi:hypothetical protein
MFKIAAIVQQIVTGLNSTVTEEKKIAVITKIVNLTFTVRES